jgi:hypothetical protein
MTDYFIILKQLQILLFSIMAEEAVGPIQFYYVLLQDDKPRVIIHLAYL